MAINHALLLKQTLTPMQFLFETITITGNKPHYYLIYKTEVGYFAELVDQPGFGFHFQRINDKWVSDDPERQYEGGSDWGGD